MISIIMPSYLGYYKKAAKNRETKIIRAVRSVFAQSFKDWELIIVADGCKKTIDIIENFCKFENCEKIKIVPLDKQPIWSGKVRNAGIEKAEGDYICYLDIDDAFAPEHLWSLQAGMRTGKDWYWFDDYVWNGEDFRRRKCNIARAGQCGTSNILHKRGLARWNNKDNYAHDWRFIGNLKRASKEYEYINAGEYLVCHVPGKFDI